MRPTTVKQVLPALRVVFYIISALAFIAGMQLIVLSRDTETYFAWSVHPSYTAVVLGGFYVAAAVFALLSARAQTWATSRTALPAAIVFTILTLLATLFHLDRLHLGPYPAFAQFLAYAWIAVYAILPVLLLVLRSLQLRPAGDDPPREEAPLPSFKILLGVQAAIGILVGAALFIIPIKVMPLWGWDLTPLTARALAAWLLALGVSGTQAIQEDDWRRMRPTMIGYMVLALAQLIGFGLAFGNPLYDNPAAFYWLGYLLLILVVGGYGTVESLRVTWMTRGPKTAHAA